MELFIRVKSILFNPKEEWEIIEAENAPHAKVLPYLLILTLIPALAIIAKYWLQWHSKMAQMKASIIGNNNYHSEQIADALARIKESTPFFATIGITGIIASVNQIAIILGGVYLAAAVINTLSDQFGVNKDFNLVFSLIAYSYIPLCISGILYFFPPIAWLVPLLGLYGLYLLFLGAKPLMKPSSEKQAGYAIMVLLVVFVAYIIVSKIVPMITTEIYSSIIASKSKL